METPLVSIVTICWNRKKDILESLKGISEIEYDNLEVIVVDNNSTDGTAEAIQKEYPNTRLIKMFRNIGIEAYNIGFKNAKGEYIVILDDDSFPEKHAITRMVKKFQVNKKLGIVAFDVRNYYSYDKVSKEMVEENKESAAESNDYLMAFNGAGAGVRRDIFEKIGFYPEEFFLYWNEQDTAFRMLDNGYQIKFFSDIVSYHKYSPQNRKSWRAPFYYSRNGFWLLWKNYPSCYATKKTLQLIYMTFYYSMEQKSFVYIKGMLHAFWFMEKATKKRKVVKDEVWKNLRIPFETSFTFFR